MKVYIAGPMRGIQYYNFPAFDKAASLLEAQGHEVMNPAAMDRKAGFDAMVLADDYHWDSVPSGFSLQNCISRDIEAVMWCDAVCMLPGWEKSTGALAEYHLAKWYGKQIWYGAGAAEEYVPLTIVDMGSAIPITTTASSEMVIGTSTTGGKKEVKLEAFNLIPPEALEALSRVFGVGSVKYRERNWEQGYSWGWSFASLMRHAWKFWKGEEVDEETGLPHIMQAAWHCIVLYTFSIHHRNFDDRSRLGWPKEG